MTVVGRVIRALLSLYGLGDRVRRPRRSAVYIGHPELKA